MTLRQNIMTFDKRKLQTMIKPTSNKLQTNFKQSYNMKRTNSLKKQDYFLMNEAYFDLFLNLPYGAATKIRKMMVEKKGNSHNYTINYINMVLDPNNKRMNIDILETAIEYLNELIMDNARLQALITNINIAQSKKNTK